MESQTGAVLACIANALCYVGLLYVWRGNLPRDHPTTIKRRVLSTALACTVSWLPIYFWATRVKPASVPVHELLGLRLEGLGRAIVDSLYLCVTLFIGPLVYFVYTIDLEDPVESTTAQGKSQLQQQQQVPHVGTSSAGGGEGAGAGSAAGSGGSSSDSWSSGFSARAAAGGSTDAQQRRGAPPPGEPTGGSGGNAAGSAEQPAGVLVKLEARVRRLVGDLRLWRNLVVAPLTEEWVFRACMAPLLVMEGLPLVRVVLLTPLFFGAAHLHHVAELMRHQHMPLGRALAAVAFQFAYTTLFGWLATFLFLRTGHLAAPLAAHVFCNWAGFPPFGEMWEHPRAVVLLLTTAGGLLTFTLQLGRMTAPGRYGNEAYGAGW
ncbi:hypothetical protein HYH02_006372 [Chlamydomonas schloesseri]|uniref:intramembrane prenyl-peptidase Rce1 n=1 Tax=Chlamydomonas schloesseri TaxID=2026947 RepID=A0A835WJA5_9CHLO|nr:hypothetical protein HYH02_006372 [Chlamydomonas schloesseri]|eukprot:KAG2448480.1 hypothetical protein HYH02_006372 [Chlamydomonas schloesseri]